MYTELSTKIGEPLPTKSSRYRVSDQKKGICNAVRHEKGTFLDFRLFLVLPKVTVRFDSGSSQASEM